MEQETKTSPVDEIWRPVRDFEDLYEVSNLARVRSLDRYYPDAVTMPDGTLAPYVRKGKIMKGFLHPTGYITIGLRNGKKCVTVLLHRIVAEAFVPNHDNLPEVNHKDEDKTNNLPSNLEWCEGIYNLNYGTRCQRISKARSNPIEQLTPNGEHVAFYDSIAEAVRLSEGKFRQPKISEAINGNRRTAHGYKWQRIKL